MIFKTFDNNFEFLRPPKKLLKERLKGKTNTLNDPRTGNKKKKNFEFKKITYNINIKISKKKYFNRRRGNRTEEHS